MQEFTKRNWLILIFFGLIGQIAWSVENMYFNLFVFETIAPDLNAVTLMVQLSGVAATVTTLIAGTLSDRAGNRRKFISYGYLIWGVTVALFGLISVELIEKIFPVTGGKAISLTLALVVAADCVMTVFGSTANDAAFYAWVTDNTQPSFRGKVESVLSVLPLLAMLIVAGGFGILVSFVGYKGLFLGLGALISVCGIVGLFTVVDSPSLLKNGTFKDIVYGFKPKVIKGNPAYYLTLLVIGIYGIACQIFMPYLIIYMKTYLGFSVVEYSVVFGAAILLGAAINILLGKTSDRHDKVKLLYLAAGILSIGLMGMYLSDFRSKTANLLCFGIAGFVMITGYIFTLSLSSATLRDQEPKGQSGKLQGIRMIFSVLLPMLIGPMIGNAINKAAALPLPDPSGADSMTTQFIPAPEIFLAGSLCVLAVFIVLPLLTKLLKEKKENGYETEN